MTRQKVEKGRVNTKYRCPNHGITTFFRLKKGQILCGDCFCDGKEVQVEKVNMLKELENRKKELKEDLIEIHNEIRILAKERRDLK